MGDAIETRAFDPRADDAFARVLFASTGARDVAALPEPLRTTLMALQFDAWTQGLARFSGLEDRVILQHAAPIGRLVLSCEAASILVVDLGLLPEARGRGVGTALLRGLLARADAERRVLRLSVRRESRARGLYERMGLRPVSSSDLDVHYEHTPR